MSTELRTDRVAPANLSLARSTVYRLLAQGFAYPTRVATEQLLEDDLPLALAVSSPFPQEVRDSLDAAAAALERVDANALEVAYRGLFSHVHSADCPLYETDYTAREIWRQSQQLADLAGFYRAFGVEEQGERPDGLSVELEFMHVVSYKEAWALVQGDEEHARLCRDAQESFLRDHLLRWAPDLVRRVEALAGGGPYAALARLGRLFLRAEALRFGLGVAPGASAPEPTAEARAVEETALCEGES